MCVLPTYVLPSAHKEKHPLHGIMIYEASKLVISNSSRQLYIQDDEKLARYWDIFLIIHKCTLLQQVYTYMLIHLLGLHNTSILLLAHCLGFFGFTPIILGGSNSRMDDQVYKHSTTRQQAITDHCLRRLPGCIPEYTLFKS
jgi:hypothetical protein